MSVMTDPVNQTYMYCGFYPSKNGDRKYGASDFNKFLDGLICDGVFNTILHRFSISVVGSSEPTSVTIDTGKAWFNNTWIELVEKMTIDCGSAPKDGNCYDSIVIAINTSDMSVEWNETFPFYFEQALPARDTNIIHIRGPIVSTDNPEPAIIAGQHQVDGVEGVYFYPIANIKRLQGVDRLETRHVSYLVGTAVCPLVTALITPSDDATDFMESWEAAFDYFVNTKMPLEWTNKKNTYDTQWYNYFNQKKTDTDEWLEGMDASIRDWFDKLVSDLSTDQAVNLWFDMTRDQIKQVLLCGFADGTKTVSEDGSAIESTDSQGNRLVTTFSEDFTTIYTYLYDANGVEWAFRQVTISPDGGAIESAFGSYITKNHAPY